MRDKSGLALAKIDTDDLPKVQEFPGTWAAHAGPEGRLYVQGKRRDPLTDQYETVYLHRWIVNADENTLIQLAHDTLDCRRENLHTSRKHRLYDRQLARRRTPTERLQYTKALASRLAPGSPLTSTQMLRGLQRGTLDVETQERASRFASERITSLPPLRLRAGWEHRLPSILAVLQGSSAQWIGRREVEQVFGVSRNTAIKILDRFGASFVGQALTLPRQELASRLQQLLVDPTVCFERERHASTLAAATKDELRELLITAAKRISSAERTYLDGSAALEHQRTHFADFPAEVHLTSSSLHINFQGFEDFLTKVGIVVYALQNDLDSIETFLESEKA